MIASTPQASSSARRSASSTVQQLTSTSRACQYATDSPLRNRCSGLKYCGRTAPNTAPNGEGANLALYDGSELGKALAAHPDDPEATLTEYEQPLPPRSAVAAAVRAELNEVLFGDNAPHGLLDMFTGSAETH